MGNSIVELCVIGLQKAIDATGGQTQLAKRISDISNKPVKQQQIWNWLNRNKRVPADKVLIVERASGVSRNTLRPDLYP
ncbi:MULTISPECIES: transcriptional regulator [Providencia]|uniref:transcriptional regulator n=1 Tax=Providencia TaxID=586 RepID=UPI000D8CF866|nr:MULTISPECIES: YdaS family helix-turn-helix protein [Providencia]MTB45860.1 cytoplasmic chaperone TorD [Providencia sp. wls1950]MTC22033.1 cytoplasmic chaperone TorD [Providencia sp. wls1938]MTC29293.1 cytoplasmic chaperone TorD [Providencia alcalifaciens]MTC40950.1 cytoplasmic chaperone TorD [Providencia sp. wls1921]UBX48850.1 helix-turn-helix domain-containing protein [Providencia alcalifaciens]